MIVPMKKLSAFVFYKEYTRFLEHLRELGVVHIKFKKGHSASSDSLVEKLNVIRRYTNAIKFLEKQKDIEKSEFTDANDLLNELEAKRIRLDKTEQILAHIRKEISIQEPWGLYSEDLINKLSESGARIDFFTCPHSKFNTEWYEQNNALEIASHGGQIYFITVSIDGQKPEIEAEYVGKPEKTLDELYQEEEDVNKEREVLFNFFKKAAGSVDILVKERTNIQNNFNFENVVAGTHTMVEDKVMYLEGWVPLDKEEKLEGWISEVGVYYEIREPNYEDRVPIKLKNNKFASLFQFIGELYSLPQYGEIDLTPFFAPFFMLFFGFCLGDAGYGLLILLGATIYKPRVKKEVKPVLSLAQWLGLATVVMGIVGGTFFGINLIEADISWLENAKKYMLDSQNLFNLSLIIGGVQIIFGMFIKFANQIKQAGLKASLATLGWIILIIGGGLTYWLGKKGMDVKNIQYGVFGISGLFILILNNPKRNVFMNFGAGLWDVYNMVTGLLGDVLSYIRLFALGISSAVLGLVFNDLAMNMSGNIPVVKQILMLLILVFGHGINIFMSGLGSFVHPMRLTFVEFYKNAGFSGGGKKYEPFVKLEK